MYTNQIQILLRTAKAYVTIAHSLRSSGISSWQYYAKQAKTCIYKAKQLEKADRTITIQLKLVG